MLKDDIVKILNYIGADEDCYEIMDLPNIYDDYYRLIQSSELLTTIKSFVTDNIINNKQKYKVYVYSLGVDGLITDSDIPNIIDRRVFIRGVITSELCEAKKLENKLTKIMKRINENSTNN